MVYVLDNVVIDTFIITRRNLYLLTVNFREGKSELDKAFIVLDQFVILIY